MSHAYEEIIAGDTVHRRAPSGAHELLVGRLHAYVAAALPMNSKLQLLPPRSGLRVADDFILRPDLAVVRTEPGLSGPAKLYLIAEVLLPGDHHVDTVVKKQMWSDFELPRLWMVDPRYLNVEVYSRGEYGFTLQDILAHHHRLTDPHLAGLGCSMDELFANV